MIDLEITDGVAFITLNAPATRNALNNELAGLVRRGLRRGRPRPAGRRRRHQGRRRHLLLRGRARPPGRGWPGSGGGERYAALGGIYRAFTRVGQLEMPTIAAVRGAAVGAGINLMLATDLRIVAEDEADQRLPEDRAASRRRALRVLAGRAGTEAAAAAGIFGEEIRPAGRAARPGLGGPAVGAGRGAGRRARPAGGSRPAAGQEGHGQPAYRAGPPRLPWTAALEVERRRSALVAAPPGLPIANPGCMRRRPPLPVSH